MKAGVPECYTNKFNNPYNSIILFLSALVRSLNSEYWFLENELHQAYQKGLHIYYVKIWEKVSVQKIVIHYCFFIYLPLIDKFVTKKTDKMAVYADFFLYFGITREGR